MSKIELIIENLSNKINNLLHNYSSLKQKNRQLYIEIGAQQEQISILQDKLLQCQERYQSLKIANSMLGSSDNKRETKLKINALIRDIDHCISQLSK